MKLLIELDEEVFNEIVSADDASHLSRAFLKGSHLYFKESLQNGTPLPKGHGRLIDADKIQFENTEFDTYGDYSRAFDAIDYAPTVIEADKEKEE